MRIVFQFLIVKCLFLPYYAHAQEEKSNNKFTITSESVVKYHFKDMLIRENFLTPIGNVENEILYQYEDKDENIEFYLLNESSHTFMNIFTDLNLNGSSLYAFTAKDSMLFFKEIYFESMDDYGYSQLTLQNNQKVILLDSIYNSDKKIHSSFSSDGKYLLVNTLNTLSDYYNPAQDNRIIVYDLKEIGKGKINKEYIPCEHCSDSYLVGDKIFFMKANERDAYGGFDNTEIYVAPWGKLQDSIKIASTSKIVAISPDSKYILATRFFDTQHTTCVIIDVEEKKYQLLLGRDYAKAKAFYSYHEEKFAFDFGGWIVYIDLPKEFPFNALNWRNSEIPDVTEHSFWEQYLHPPFEER